LKIYLEWGIGTLYVLDFRDITDVICWHHLHIYRALNNIIAVK